MFDLRVSIDLRLGFGLPSAIMAGWLDRLTNSVSVAAEVERQDAEHKKYIIHKAGVLKARGSEVWLDFVRRCKDDVAQLNARLALKFPDEQDKQIEWQDRSPNSFSLCGKFPSFSMDATYDVERQSISLGGTRRLSGTIECRSETFPMDLNKGGNPCLKLGQREIDIGDASRHLLGLCLASKAPSATIRKPFTHVKNFICLDFNMIRDPVTYDRGAEKELVK